MHMMAVMMKNTLLMARQERLETEVDVIVQNTSKVRVFVTGKRHYKIGNLDGVLPVAEPSEDRLDKSIRDFLALGKNK